jgi:hypothetical protein
MYDLKKIIELKKNQQHVSGFILNVTFVILLTDTLDCPYLIATSVFYNVYLLKFFRLFGDS